MAVRDVVRKVADAVTGKRDDSFDFKKLKGVVDKIYDSPDNEKIRNTQNRFMKRFKGDWWDVSKMKETDSTIQINLFFATVMTIAPLLTDNKPIWAARARKPYLQDYIEGLSLALEYLWDKVDMDRKTFLWILDALIMKIGIIKCYFDPEAEFGGEVEIGIVDPRTFFCAPGYDDIWKAPLCGTKTPMPLSWIRMNYPETGKDVKPDDSKDNINGSEQSWELDTKFANVYEVWLKDSEMEDYFLKEEGGKQIETDKKDPEGKKSSRSKYPNGRIVVFTKDALLDDKASIYKHGKPPYVDLQDYPVPHELIGMGEADQIEEMGKSLNRLMQLLDTWTKYYCDAPWLLDTNSGLDAEQVKGQLAAGGGFFEANMSQNPDPLKKVQGGQLDQAVPMLISILQKFHDEITGITDVTKGMTGKSQRQSATEISTLAESAYTRTRQRVRNYESSIKRLLYLQLSIMQQFYTEPRNFSLTSDNQVNYYTVGSSNAQVQQTIGTPNSQMPPGPDGQPVKPNEPEQDAKIQKDYENFIADFGTEDEVYAAFDLEVQTNSSLPMDRQSLANLYLRLLEMAQGNPVTGMPMWEAVLSSLRIPRYKEIIGKMEDLFQKSQPPQQAPGAPPGQPDVGGPPQMMSLIQRAGGQ